MDNGESAFNIRQCVAIVGLGLIGGSYAKGLKKLGVAKIMAFEPNRQTLRQALLDDVIDEAHEQGSEALRKADLVIFCTAAKVMIDFIDQNRQYFKDGAVLTDVAGIKNGYIKIIEELLPPGVDFVPGHPMAGREGSGYGMSDASIFTNANYILVPRPENPPQHIKLVEAMARSLGCSHVVCVSTEEHDALIAYTSSLPHVLATALVNSEAMNDKTKYFVAGSFRDGTRVADINAPLWTQLFLSNKKNLLYEINRFTASLAHFSQLLENEDEAGMTGFLQQAAQRRRELVHETHSR